MLPDVHVLRDRSDKFQFDYPIAMVVLGICTAAAIFLRSRVAITNIAMLHLLGTIVVSVTCRRAVAVSERPCRSGFVLLFFRSSLEQLRS